ncbi:MAG: L,D-transpeptidase family protein [Nocardioidaceae bacterium]
MRRGQKIGTAIVLTVGLVAAGGAAYAGLTLTGLTDTAPRAVADGQPGPTPAATGTRTPAATPSTSPTPTTRPTDPRPALHPGAAGPRVRELQARLSQLAWFAPPATGRYDAATRAAVAGFQHKRGLATTGVVDPRTWRRLLAMTQRPTDAELFNRPGPALYQPGDRGPQVREIQARLRQIAWLSGDVTSSYDGRTRAAVLGFQGKRGVPQTGAVDRRTLDLLEGMTTEPTKDELANVAPDPADGAALDPRCTTGRALCIDKTSSSLRWVVDGKVQMSLDVRFGASYSPTREGLFHVYWKDRDHVSNMYGSAMPFSMFFSRGQAVHYSSDFAARGYAGASHGCVNVRDYSALAQLFDQVRVGDKVVVYWS